MNDFLTTNELIKMIEHTRESVNQVSHVELKARQISVMKRIYWIVVGIAVLVLVYLSLPLYVDKAKMVQLTGSQVVSAAKKGQTPPTIDLTLISVSKYVYEDLQVGDYVIVFSVDIDVYLEKQVISIDTANQTFDASYAGQTAATYSSDKLIGIYASDANFFQTFMYSMSTVRGYLGTVGLNVVVFVVGYFILFKETKIEDEEDSDFDE